jgi:hypothetical protein
MGTSFQAGVPAANEIEADESQFNNEVLRAV